MTKVELTRFRNALNKRRTELEHGNRGLAGNLSIDSSPDELDRIQHGQERDFAMGTLDRASKQLREVRAALDRMDTGTFGTCIECEEDIDLNRLAAVPWTALCIGCQEAAEQMAGNPWSAPGDLLVSAA